MIIFRAVERGVEIPENLDEAGLAELDRAVKAEQTIAAQTISDVQPDDTKSE